MQSVLQDEPVLEILEQKIETHYAYGGAGFPVTNSVWFGSKINKLNLEDEVHSLQELFLVDPFDRASIFLALEDI